MGDAAGLILVPDCAATLWLRGLGKGKRPATNMDYTSVPFTNL